VRDFLGSGDTTEALDDDCPLVEVVGGEVDCLLLCDLDLVPRMV